MSQARAIVDIGGEGEQGKILAVHAVAEVKYFREPGPGDLRLIPGTVLLLGREQVTQPALHAGPVEITARTDTHERPRSL